MDNGSTFPYRRDGAKGGRRRKNQPPDGGRCEARDVMKPGGKSPGRAKRAKRAQATSGGRGGQEKPLSDEISMSVPQTDTGGRVENTKANGATLVKELGNIAA